MQEKVLRIRTNNMQIIYHTERENMGYLDTVLRISYSIIGTKWK